MNDDQMADALRRTLDDNTRGVAARPNADDLLARVDRRTGRERRWLIGVLAAVLAVAGVVGYGIGDERGAGGPGINATIQPGDDGPGSTDTPILHVVRGDDQDGIPGPLARLFLRTTADDISIRAYRSGSASAVACGGGSCPPASCLPTGQTVAEISTGDAVGIGVAPSYAHPPRTSVTNSGMFGVSEGAPVAWWVIDAGGGRQPATVRANFPDDRGDAMEFVDGTAVLAHAMEAPGGEAQVFDADGKVLAVLDLAPDQSRLSSMPECMPRVVPTVTTPAPNGPPPDDPEAARAAIVQAFHDVMTGGVPQEVKDAARESATELKPLQQEALAYGNRIGYSNEQLAGNTVTVSGVRFTDPTHAEVSYTLTIPGHGNVFTNRKGYAVFVDGRWKVARQTACDNVAMAGVRCP